MGENPGKTVAYTLWGLLAAVLFLEIGNAVFRLIFMAVMVFGTIGIAVRRHLAIDDDDEPFWPVNPLLLPVRAAQGFFYAVAVVVGTQLAVLFWLMVIALGISLIGVVIYFLNEILYPGA